MKLGIVGPGLIWNMAHRPTLAGLGEEIEPVAFACTSDATASAVAAEYPGLPCYRDYRRLADDPGVEGVLVLTPIPLNAPVATYALNAGKTVFLEKPVAASLTQLVALEDAVAQRSEAGGGIYVLENLPYAAGYRAVADLIAGGALGTFASFEWVSHFTIDAEDDQTGGFGGTVWRSSPEYPVGTLFDGGVHQIAALTSLLSVMPEAPRVETVYALGRSLREGFGDYDLVGISLGLAATAATQAGPARSCGYFSHAGYLPGDENYVVLRGTDATITVRGDEWALSRRGQRTSGTFDTSQTHGRMWREVLDSLREGREAPYTFAQAAADVRIMLAVDRSLRESRAVPVGEVAS